MKLHILLALSLFLNHKAFPQTLLTNYPVPNGDIYAFAKDANWIYIGGTFTEVNSIAHSKLARFDAVTGALDNTWSPQAGTNHVTCLAVAGSKLIAGGSFTNVDGQNRLGICMFDLVSGNLDSWSDSANFLSWRMGIGTFNNLFYYARMENFGVDARIVCVDANTGSFTGWQSDSSLSGSVNAIYASGGHVYVGGQFTLSGGSSGFNNLCRFDQVTGALDLTWQPNPPVNNFGVTAIVKTNDEIFVGGDFNSIAGQSREGVAAFDSIGNLTSFNQNSSSYEVLSLFGDGDYIWVGGNSSSLGGQLRYRIAQISIANSQATCWNASATSSGWSTVQAILVTGDTVFAGPFGNMNLGVFNDSPLPLQGTAISGPDSVLPNQVANYSVPFVAGHTYNWTVTGGTGTSTTNSITVTWGAGPSGSVSVVQANPTAGNCSADTSLMVTISGSTAIDERLPEQNIVIASNPATGEITVGCNENIDELTLFDYCGKAVYKVLPAKNVYSFQPRQMASGLYLVLLKAGQKHFTEKLIVY